MSVLLAHQSFEFIGGSVCLDFVNTVHNYGAAVDPDDDLVDFSALVAWAQQAKIINTQEVRRFALEAEAEPRKAKYVLGRAKLLRDTLYRIFSSVASGRQPAQSDLAQLNSELTNCMANLRIVPSVDGFQLGWAPGEGKLDSMLWPIGRSAADLLTTTAGLDRVRVCGGSSCTWLFLDTTKNGSRRWCDMKACGNRAKSRRHYERTRPKQI